MMTFDDACRPARRLALLAAGLLLAGACASGDENAITVAEGEEFQLRIGQSAVIDGAEITVTFVDVTMDSRCGRGEQCITAGDAIVRVQLEHSSGETGERDLHAGPRQQRSADFANFNIGLVALHPERLAGKDIVRSQYLATFRVSRGSAGGELVY